MDLNTVFLIGNVSKQPEVKKFDSGSSVTKLNVATGYAWEEATTKEKKEKVAFHTVIGWNGLGSTMEKYLKKGDKVFIEGRLDYRTYEAGDGTTKYVTDIVASRLIMLGGKSAPVDSPPQEHPVENSSEENPL